MSWHHLQDLATSCNAPSTVFSLEQLAQVSTIHMQKHHGQCVCCIMQTNNIMGSMYAVSCIMDSVDAVSCKPTTTSWAVCMLYHKPSMDCSLEQPAKLSFDHANENNHRQYVSRICSVNGLLLPAELCQTSSLRRRATACRSFPKPCVWYHSACLIIGLAPGSVRTCLVGTLHTSSQ